MLRGRLESEGFKPSEFVSVARPRLLLAILFISLGRWEDIPLCWKDLYYNVHKISHDLHVEYSEGRVGNTIEEAAARQDSEEMERRS